MKKKWICIALICSMMLSVTGCGNAIPEMSDEQMTLVTEYAAALLLKYDSGYEPMLLDDEHLAAEEEMQKRIEEEAARMEALEAARDAAKQEESQSETENSGIEEEQEAAVVIDPADFLELSGVSISCNGVEFKYSYPDSGDDLYFAVTASKGCKLAVVHLEIINTGSTESNIDIFNKNAKYKVSFNGGTYHNVMMTMLENDFSMYVGTLAPGEKADTVLLVDLKEEECASPATIDLYMKYNGESIKTSVY